MAKLKLTPEIQDTICDLITKGVTVENIIDIVGIGKTTYYQWISIGEAHTNGVEHERMPHKMADRETYANFANAVTHAHSNALSKAEVVAYSGLESAEETLQSVDEVTEIRLRTVQRVDENGKTVIEKIPYEYKKLTKRTQKRTIPASPDYAIKYLSRRDAKQWAETSKQEITGADGGKQQIEHTFKWEDLIKRDNEHSE